jgi:hypothetical protein
MTVSTTTNKDRYSGNGTTTSFDTTFKFFNNSEVSVIYTDASGVDTTWVEDTDYTLTGGSGATGTVTPTTIPASGTTLTILRTLTLTQTLDLVRQGAFDPEAIEAALDKLVMMAQQTSELNDRALVTASTDVAPAAEIPNATTRADKFLKFDSNGDPTAVSSVTPGSVTISSFAETYLDDATASATLDTLGFTTLTKGFIAETTSAGARDEIYAASQGANVFANTQTWKYNTVVAASNLSPDTGNIYNVTGTTNINTIADMGDGTILILIFAASLTIAHDNTNMRLPGNTNLTVEAGDVMVLVQTGNAASIGQWACIAYQHDSLPPSKGSGWELITTTTLSGGTSVDFLSAQGFDPTTYEDFMLVLDRVASDTDSADIYLRLSDDDSTFEADASDYTHTTQYTTDSANTYFTQATANTIPILANLNVGNVAADENGVCGEITIFGAGNTAGYSHIHFKCSAVTDTGLTSYADGVAQFRQADDILGARIYISLGTFSGGTVRLYGRRG